MKNYTITFKKIELAIAVFLFLAICIAFIPVVDATKYDYPVPWMNQKYYVDIKESACGPTSIGMLLNYYYPNSKITGKDVYHSGTQEYKYLGPAVGYKDVSFATNNKGQPLDKGLSIVDPEFRNCYSNLNSGMNINSGSYYLKHYWGGTSSVVYNFPPMTEEIKKRPAVVNVRNAITPGHYIILRGYDDHNTPVITDDTYYVNDPYPGWLGENGAVSYSNLKALYKNRIITYVPSLDAEHRKYTTLVDGSHVQLDNINAKDASGYIWREYYGGGGDWYFPTTEGHSVTWTPDLKIEGKYNIHIIFYDNNKGNNIIYSVYSPGNSNPIATLSITQKGTKTWRDEIIESVDLKIGSYVKVNNVPAKCNVDAVRFEYAEASIPNPVLPTALTQYKSDGVTGIAVGGTTTESTVVMKGGVSDPKGNTVKLDVEVKPVGSQFTGTPKSSSALIASGSTASVTVTGLANGQYKWQARATNSQGISGPWQSAGGNAKNQPDFVISEASVTGSPVERAPVTLKVSPNSGKQGTTFSFSGRGYTPRRAIEYHVRKPDNTEYPATMLTASGSGALSYKYKSTNANMVGTYTIWTIDRSTGRQSNDVQETITAAPVTLKVSPSSGRQGTTFTFRGNDYTPKGSVEYHVKKPDNTEYPVTMLTATSSGSLSYKYKSTSASMVGTYTIWTIDRSTGRQSNDVQETIIK